MVNFLRLVGDEVQQALVHAARRRAAADEKTIKLFEYTLGPKPRLLGGIVAEAALAETSRRTWPDLLQDAAIVVTTATECVAMATFSHVNFAIETKKLQPLACISHIALDETPMHLNASIDALEPGRKAKHIVKVLQAEACVALICKVPKTGQVVTWAVPIPTPPVGLDSAPAEAILQCLQKVFDVPLWRPLCARFPLHCAHSQPTGPRPT